MKNIKPHQKNLDIYEQIKQNTKQSSIETKRQHPYSKVDLWKAFQKEYLILHSKTFLYNDDNVIKNIKPLFCYFLESDAFFECRHLRTDISAPSFKKGLLLFGNVGVGKSHIMQTFQSLFAKYQPHRFTMTPTHEVVDKYEATKSPEDRNHFYKTFTNGTILFDDLNSEKVANNFGHVNIMKEVILRRCTLNKKTHLIMNPLPGFEDDTNGSLLKLGDNYDQRMVDRFYEMFNIIELKGKSMRR
ncbi:hypothetical protein GCM10022291_18330 [Postechiella marina]|uniref:Uncharacterized protein n=1 Tax=Postechiella marina TaxID=943941 RepID=A0ABP8C9C4_9FLAO